MPVAAAVTLAVSKPLFELDIAVFGHALVDEVFAAVAVLQTLGVTEALVQAVSVVLFLIAAVQARVRVKVGRIFALRIIFDAASTFTRGLEHIQQKYAHAWQQHTSTPS